MESAYFHYMVQIRRQILVLLQGILCSGIGYAQWTQTNGPRVQTNVLGGNRIEALAVNGSILYAGGGGGLYRSSDNGVSWTSFNNGLLNTSIRTIAVSGPAILVGTYGGGVFKSIDSGSSWIDANNGLTDPYITTVIESGASLFVGTSNHGVFRSTNNGNSWTRMNNGLTDTSVTALAVSGTTLFAGTASTVFRTSNNGGTWAPVNINPITVNGFPDSYVRSLTVGGTANAIFAGIGSSGIYRSIDNGNSWVQVNNGLTDLYVEALAKKDTALFAATSNSGIYRSNDNGSTWSQASNGLIFSERFVYEFAINGSDIFVGTANGVFRSSDMGDSWFSANGGYSFISANVVATSGSTLFAASWSRGIYRSIDSGFSWARIDSGMLPYVNTFFVSGSTIFAGTYGVYRSADNGISWSQIGLTNRRIYALATSGFNLFAGTDSGLVYHSYDNGDSWTGGRLIGTSLQSRVTNLALMGSTLIAGTNDRGVFRSADSGTSWVQVNNGLTNPNIQALAVNDSSLFAGTNYGGVFRSTDSGSSWTQVNNGLTNSDVLTMTVTGSILFVGTTGSRVYRTSDNGDSWTQVSSGMPVSYNVRTLAFMGSTLFAGLERNVANNGGVWKRSISDMLIPDAIISIHKPTSRFGFGFGSTMPPLRRGSNIIFLISHHSLVTLVLFAADGKKAATLVNSELVRGTHQTVFNNHGFPRGLYFLQLRSNGLSQTIRVLVEK